MKRLLIAALLLLPAGAWAQNVPAGLSPATIAGTLYASNFANWTVPSGNMGPYQWSNASACTVTSGAVSFIAFKAGTPFKIVDANPALNEVVVPSGVTVGNNGCRLTVTPVYTHNSFYLTTATAGLQEAINFAQGLPFLVLITPDFTRDGGVTSTITTAAGSTAVSILDVRNAVLVPYTWNGSAYVATGFATAGVTSFNTRTGVVTLTNGDVIAAYGNQSPHVICAVGPVSGSAAPTSCRTMTLDEFGPAFAISSFTCSVCGTVEAGVTTGSPATFTASYSSLPGSATIFDGTNTATLTTPFTSGSLAHSYCTTGAAVSSTTFTLTAIAATTQTAAQTITCAPRFFGGVGTGTASTATASGTNAVLGGGGGGTLTSAGVANSQVGLTVGSYCPSSQFIYLLLIGGSHTFKDANTGFAMSFNPPTAVTFVNQYGVTVGSEFLYQTTFALNACYAPQVVS